MERKLVDQIVLAGLIVLAVLLYISTADYTGIAAKTSAKYVRFLAVCLGGLSAVQLATTFFRAQRPGKLELAANYPRFFGLLACLILYAMCFETLGFFIPALVFIPAVAILLGNRNWLVIALTTTGTVAFVYLVFVTLLGVNLPGPKL